MFLVFGGVPVHVAPAAAARVEVLVLGAGPRGGLGDHVRVAGGLGAALARFDVRGFHVAGAAALRCVNGSLGWRF